MNPNDATSLLHCIRPKEYPPNHPPARSIWTIPPQIIIVDTTSKTATFPSLPCWFHVGLRRFHVGFMSVLCRFPPPFSSILQPFQNPNFIPRKCLCRPSLPKTNLKTCFRPLTPLAYAH